MFFTPMSFLLNKYLSLDILCVGILVLTQHVAFSVDIPVLSLNDIVMAADDNLAFLS